MRWLFFSSILFLLGFVTPAFAEWEQWQGTVVIHEAEFSGPVNINWNRGRFNFSLVSSDGTKLASTGSLKDVGGQRWILRSAYANCVIVIAKDLNVVIGEEVLSCAGSVDDVRFTKLAE